MTDAKQATAAEPQWAAFVAMDWADKKHFWRLAPADGGQQEYGEIESTPEAVDAWATGLSVRFGGRPIAVCVEQSKGALVYMLAKYAHLVLFPVHPKTAAQYRETFCPSGAKSDPRDTASLLDLLLRHRERLRSLPPDTPQTRLLRSLVEGRRLLVNEKTRQKNRLTASLKMYFPQILQWFDQVDSPLVGDLLQRWPTLPELKRSHPGTLKKFFLEHNCRGEERIQERIAAIYKAMPATEDEAIVVGESVKARALVELLAVLRCQIAEYDRRIAELVAVHPDSSLFASLPGAGEVLIPRLIAAFGTRRERFDRAYEVQCLSGIAPVTEKSGKTEWVHFRWACPKFLRQTFHEFAAHSIGSSGWAEAYYRVERENNKSHHAAVRSLAYKWIRIIFWCWKDGKPYDEQTYLQALKRTGSPLIDRLQLDTQGKWKPVAGFQKFSALPS
ncbi:MAG: transposase [Bryobacteraceae bacterium]